MSQENHLKGGSLWTCNPTATLPMLWDAQGGALGTIKRNAIVLLLEDTRTDTHAYAHILVENKACYVDSYWWKLEAFIHLVPSP